MNAWRQSICNRCTGYKAGEHGCDQACYPRGEEWETAIAMGVYPEDPITPESVDKVMTITLKPECKEKMLEAHSLEWWAIRIRQPVWWQNWK